MEALKMVGNPGVVAVPSMGPDTAGAITWWRLDGDTSLERLAQEWGARGLDPKLLPAPPTPEQALRRAMRDQEERHRLVRPLPGGNWALVQETVENGELSYRTVLRVGLFEDGSLALNGDDSETVARDEIRASFQRYSGILTSGTVSDWLVRLSAGLRAVSLRDTGGIYFVPRTQLGAWRQYADALRASSSHSLFEVPALRTEEAVDAILDAVQQEAQADVEALGAALESDMGPRGLSNRAAKAGAMLEKLRSYEQLLGRSMSGIADKLTSLQADLAAAALAKDEEAQP